MSASSITVANTALSLLSGNRIPYTKGGSSLSGMDCQGLVEYCIKQSGGNYDYSGSNAMFRNGLSLIYKYDEAVKNNAIKRGMLCFIVDPVSAQTPAKYRYDSVGDASHVGIVTLDSNAWSVDASASAGCVRARTERDAKYVWTHVGYALGVDYDGKQESVKHKPLDSSTIIGQSSKDENEIVYINSNTVENVSNTYEEIEPEPVPLLKQYRALVSALNGGMVNIRSLPTTFVDNRVGKAPTGSIVIVKENKGDWSKVEFMGKTGWMQSQFIERLEV